MAKTIAVKLKCNYGEGTPGTKVDMDVEKAKTFVLEGLGEYVTEDDTISQEDKVLQDKIAGLNATAVTLNQTIEAQKVTIAEFKDSNVSQLKQEIATLKGKNTKLTNEIKSLKGA